MAESEKFEDNNSYFSSFILEYLRSLGVTSCAELLHSVSVNGLSETAKGLVTLARSSYMHEEVSKFVEKLIGSCKAWPDLLQELFKIFFLTKSWFSVFYFMVVGCELAVKIHDQSQDPKLRVRELLNYMVKNVEEIVVQLGGWMTGVNILELEGSKRLAANFAKDVAKSFTTDVIVDEMLEWEIINN